MMRLRNFLPLALAATLLAPTAAWADGKDGEKQRRERLYRDAYRDSGDRRGYGDDKEWRKEQKEREKDRREARREAEKDRREAEREWRKDEREAEREWLKDRREAQRESEKDRRERRNDRRDRDYRAYPEGRYPGPRY